MPRRKKTRPEIRHRQDNAPFTTLAALYDELNQALFGGRLHHSSEVRLEWRTPAQSRGFLGKIGVKWGYQGFGNRAIPLRGSAWILVRSGMTDRQTRKTMAHEMAHLAAAMEDGTFRHNATFWRIMAEIGYPKDHRFIGETSEEMDLWSAKSISRDAVRVWRKVAPNTPCKVGGIPAVFLEAQRRGTKVRICHPLGYPFWIEADRVKAV